MGYVLVEHDSIEHNAVLKETTGDLFDLGVSLNIDLNMLTVLLVDSLNCFHSEVSNETAPLAGELGTNARLNDLLEVNFIFDVNGLL